MSLTFPISRPFEGGPAVLWGGALPSGGLKYYTYADFLRTLPAGTRGLVEISGASTALALDALGRERGLPLPTVALTDAGGAEYLRARGFQGEVRTITGMGEALALALEYERQGFLWPRQFTNVALVRHVEVWAQRLLEQVRATLPGVRHLVCGFGTGATLAGLHRVFTAAGYSVEGLQPAPGHTLSGWRHYAQQNLGEEDVFHPFREAISLQTAPAEPEALKGGLGALLAHVRARPHLEETLVVSHNGRPGAVPGASH